MGLNICQQILSCCEGHIDVHSEGENKGSTFIFSMKMELIEHNYDENIILPEYDERPKTSVSSIDDDSLANFNSS